MIKYITQPASVLLLLTAFNGQADVPRDLQAEYAALTGDDFQAKQGEVLWNRTHQDPKTGQDRSCSLCHGRDLKRPGEHARTGKHIDPMAPSVNPKRLSDAAKVKKWLKRNCKWTLGRECTAQEKGDLLSFISSR